jgi:FkbM family methyltransferase
MIPNLAREVYRWAQSVYKKERFYRAEVHCAHVRLGNRHAAFVVNPDLLGESSVIYSFGIGTDVSFDLECIQRFSAPIHAFDPTPRSIEWLARQELPSRFVAYPIGIAAYDGTLELYPPLDPTHVSYSVVERKVTAVSCPVYKLRSIMTSLGHDHIDLLKLDIEGAEYSVLPDVLRDQVPIRQICVEFHHRWREIGALETDAIIDALRGVGYRLFSVSPSGEEFSFLISPASICKSESTVDRSTLN